MDGEPKCAENPPNRPDSLLALPLEVEAAVTHNLCHFEVR
jgi:hypothetical protein